jgi:hypothetical protein
MNQNNSREIEDVEVILEKLRDYCENNKEGYWYVFADAKRKLTQTFHQEVQKAREEIFQKIHRFIDVNRGYDFSGDLLLQDLENVFPRYQSELDQDTK